MKILFVTTLFCANLCTTEVAALKLRKFVAPADLAEELAQMESSNGNGLEAATASALAPINAVINSREGC